MYGRSQLLRPPPVHSKEQDAPPPAGWPSPRVPTSLIFLSHLPRRPLAVLRRHDTKGVLQNNLHFQPGAHGISLPTRAEGLHTALCAYPKPDTENPGWNPKLVTPPAPIHNPSGCLPLRTLPLLPAPAVIRRPSVERVSHWLFIYHEYSTRSSAATGCTKEGGERGP